MDFNTFFGYEELINNWEPAIIVFGHIFGLILIGILLPIIFRWLPNLIYRPIVTLSCALGMAGFAGLPILGLSLLFLEDQIATTKLVWISLTLIAFNFSFVVFNRNAFGEDIFKK